MASGQYSRGLYQESDDEMKYIFGYRVEEWLIAFLVCGIPGILGIIIVIWLIMETK